MAKQVLQCICEACSLDFFRCTGQSNDNAANMSGCYEGMQQKTVEENKSAMYVPCGAH